MSRPSAHAVESFQHSQADMASFHLSNQVYDMMPHLASAPRELPSAVHFSGDIYGGASPIENLPPLTADQIKPVLDSATSVSFTTPSENQQSGQQPDFFLGEDGKLRANPDKTTPNQDGSINIELQSKNKQEVDGKKLADQLQKAAIKDLISYFSKNNKGAKIPQDWLDILQKTPDLPPAPVPLDPVPQAPPAVPPQDAPPPQQQAPQEAPHPSDTGGGGGSSAGSGNSSGGGGGHSGGDSSGNSGSGSRPSGSDSGGGSTNYDAPKPSIGDTSNIQPTKDVPSPTDPGTSLAHLEQAIQRANSGGTPLSILQYGDSHIAGGIEPKSIEDAFKSIAPVDYHTMAKGGIAANYPLLHTQEWLDQPIKNANPDLIILSFGTNDGAVNVDKAHYEQTYQKLIDNVRERAPNASILIVGPSDGDSLSGPNEGHPLPGLDTVIEVQKELAAKNGLDFFDLRTSMGGTGSIDTWRANGMAQPDKVHFTAKGYETIGKSIFQHVDNELNNKQSA